MGKIKIKWVKSSIGTKPDHKRTIRALGLRKLNNEVIQEATPQIIGMINKVCYMLEVEEVK